MNRSHFLSALNPKSFRNLSSACQKFSHARRPKLQSLNGDHDFAPARIISRVARAARLLAATILSVVLISCESAEPLGPTPLDEGIVVYLHSGYRGVSQQIGGDVEDLGDVEGPCGASEGGVGTWNDCISSIRVLPGWSARIYGDKNYRGAVLDVNADIPDLKAVHGSCSDSYNDCISSIRVFKN